MNKRQIHEMRVCNTLYEFVVERVRVSNRVQPAPTRRRRKREQERKKGRGGVDTSCCFFNTHTRINEGAKRKRENCSWVRVLAGETHIRAKIKGRERELYPPFVPVIPLFRAWARAFIRVYKYIHGAKRRTEGVRARVICIILGLVLRGEISVADELLLFVRRRPCCRSFGLIFFFLYTYL